MRYNARKFCAVIAAALLALLYTASFAYAEEVITDYRQNISISSDSTLTVTENITARVENINITHGIIRYFPVTYQNENGSETNIIFDVDTVMLDGRAEQFTTEEDGNYIKIKIGSGNRTIRPGLHTFTIRYTALREVGFFDSHDELYWNVTGNYWTFPIEKASCTVALPNRAAGTGFNSIEWYVGSSGEKGVKSDAELTASNGVVTTRRLEAGEGLTVVFTWPKGIVSPPPPPAVDNTTAHTVIGALVLLLMSLWFTFAWKKWGKDPIKATIPLFAPPKNLSPASVQYVRLLKTDMTAFSANIIDLAVKGAITIEEQEGKKGLIFKDKNRYILHKTDIKVIGLPEDEAALLERIFASDDTVDISGGSNDDIHAAFTTVKVTCKSMLDSIFTYNDSKCLVGAIIYAAGAIALYPWSGEYPTNMTFVGICGVILIILALRHGKEPVKALSATLHSFRRLIAPVLITLAGVSGITFEGQSPLPFLLFAASTYVMNVMVPLMMVRTERGADLLNQTDGLKLYMDTAEKNRLEMLASPEETPQLFEKLLPYALVLGSAKTWADKFDSVLKKADYKPEWYNGPSGGNLFWSAMMINSFTSGFYRDISTSSSAVPPSDTGSAPGSFSGFGGGGFSGGGGGGGGGSGW